jgi:hypothetical protein
MPLLGTRLPISICYRYGKRGNREVLLGRLRIGNMDAEAYSQIKAGRITFDKSYIRWGQKYNKYLA